MVWEKQHVAHESVGQELSLELVSHGLTCVHCSRLGCWLRQEVAVRSFEAVGRLQVSPPQCGLSCRPAWASSAWDGSDSSSKSPLPTFTPSLLCCIMFTMSIGQSESHGQAHIQGTKRQTSPLDERSYKVTLQGSWIHCWEESVAIFCNLPQLFSKFW
jgi:hypothetical protein